MTLEENFPIEITNQFEGERIDRFLSNLPGFPSRSKISELIDHSHILVNSKVCKSSYKLKKGDVLTYIDHSSDYLKKSKELLNYRGPKVEILYEDEKLVVVNKPEGLTVHPGAGKQIEDTLAGWLIFEKKISQTLNWNKELIEEGRIGIVHRLDKGTSGVILLAKDPLTHMKLTEKFQNKEIHRYYWAILEGNIEAKLSKRHSMVDAYIHKGWAALRRNSMNCWSIVTHHGRDPKNPLKFKAVRDSGKKAISHFVCHQLREADSFIELKLDTGRTHQIRVQMNFLGCPVMGDTLYGAKEASRIYLHAHKLEFVHPWTKKVIEVDATSRSFESFSKILGYRPQNYDTKILSSSTL